MNNFIEVIHDQGITKLILSRPEKRNALSGPFIHEFIQVLKKSAQEDTRALILKSSSEHFCAGGDIAWMHHIANESEDKNYQDAQALADLLYLLYHYPKPTIALVQGAAMGGGLGLVSACDIAIAGENARFGLPEVKIGLAPSIISPYVLQAIGERAAHYYFLTGITFDAQEAYRLGLVHQVVSMTELESIGNEIANRIKENSPTALLAAKQLLKKVSKEKITERLAQMTAEHLAELRMSADAQTRLKAFVEKGKSA